MRKKGAGADIQVFSADAKEKLSIFGNMDGSMPDVKHVTDFAKMRDTLIAKVEGRATPTDTPGVLYIVEEAEITGSEITNQLFLPTVQN